VGTLGAPRQENAEHYIPDSECDSHAAGGEVEAAMSRRLLTWIVSLLLCGAPLAEPAAALVETVCIGDCDQDAQVDIADLITAVKVVLGDAPLNDCPSIFCDLGEGGSIACLLAAVNTALNDGCQPPQLGDELCGDMVCPVGEYCCNPLFSICAPPGEYCIQ
jgi:hypothetical protein